MLCIVVLFVPVVLGFYYHQLQNHDKEHDGGHCQFVGRVSPVLARILSRICCQHRVDGSWIYEFGNFCVKEGDIHLGLLPGDRQSHGSGEDESGENHEVKLHG